MDNNIGNEKATGENEGTINTSEAAGGVERPEMSQSNPYVGISIDGTESLVNEPPAIILDTRCESNKPEAQDICRSPSFSCSKTQPEENTSMAPLPSLKSEEAAQTNTQKSKMNDIAVAAPVANTSTIVSSTTRSNSCAATKQRATTTSQRSSVGKSFKSILPIMGGKRDAAAAAVAAEEPNRRLVADDRIPLILLSLPIDSLHCIASFLTPTDWANFGLTGKGTNRVSREVFRRVRMHGFRCATEIVTAWKLGQHSDARELAALYTRSGVPIYPLSHGHSYHTLIWRMGIETREMETQEDSSAAAGNEEEKRDDDADSGVKKVDRFYSDRYAARAHEGYYIPALTYVEEKSLFWYGRRVGANGVAGAASRPTVPGGNRGMAAANAANNQGRNNMGMGAPPPQDIPGTGAAAVRTSLSDPRNQMFQSPLIRHSSNQGQQQQQQQQPVPYKPKLTVKIHKHLADQHTMGRASVDDENGAMVAPPCSLWADFFHPPPAVSQVHHEAEYGMNFSGLPDASAAAAAAQAPEGLPPTFYGRDTPGLGLLPPSELVGMTSEGLLAAMDDEELASALMVAAAAEEEEARASAEGAGTDQDGGRVLMDLENLRDGNNAIGEDNLAGYNLAPPIPGDASSMMGQPDHQMLQPSPAPLPPESSVMSDVELDVYSSGFDDNHEGGAPNHLKELRVRFAKFQRKLDSSLTRFDSGGFDECLLDFWDDFFPLTAGIHFYDRYTAVPRQSCLHRFLTKPCPKAIGIVQCEIERIKTSSKKKGVNMKGRLFPTYEYRLFIRDRKHGMEPLPVGASEPIRHDTVLMSAKNKGRNHQGASGIASPSSSSTKKGVNNYYLFLPQESDRESHYKTVNNIESPKSSKKDSSKDSPSHGIDPKAPELLGRLQSNFIGTEFQIFSPTLKKVNGSQSSTPPSSVSPIKQPDSEVLDSDESSEPETFVPVAPSVAPVTTSRPRSIVRRLSNPRLLRRSSTRGLDSSNEERNTEDKKSKLSLRRVGSLPNLYGSRSKTNRRVADSLEGGQAGGPNSLLCEEEDGVITYTANLLGNRPRIMDVCIPRVSEDGVAGADWKRYCESSDDGVESNNANRMLTKFKQVQQRLENAVDGLAQDDGGRPGLDIPPDFGLLALQNRPPWWNIELGAFVLNFGGRVSVASVKNFQLCDRSDQEHIMLQFGRIHGRHAFTMDFQYPLTAVQAFAIAISSLQSKLSFG